MKCNSLIVVLFVCLGGSLATGGDAETQQIGFSRDVLPLLTKMNCNTAKCHGSLAGQGSLRLSPLGSDPQDDYFALAKEAGGRRIAVMHPHESLMLRRLTSPASTLRLKPESPTFRILHDWMQQGAVGPNDDEPKLIRLETSPDKVRLAKGKTADIQVYATWSDGIRREVTQWATFHSDTKEFVTVDSQGQMSAVEPGFAAVQVRYLDQNVAVQVLVPVNEKKTKFDWTPNNLVDLHIADVWRDAGLQPADAVSDFRFSRRVHLQLTGFPPAPEAQRSFLADNRSDKRQRLVDQLLASPDYAKHWAETWSNWLLEDRWVDYGQVDWRQIRRTPSNPLETKRLQNWLAIALEQNMPIDQLAGEILTAIGDSTENGASVFYAVHATPDDMARATARSFLGVTVACARCHDHPHASWNADDFANLSACFTDLQVEQCIDGTQVRESKLTFHKSRADVSPEETKTTLQVAFQNAANAAQPRQALANWIRDGGRHMLARNIVNRCWIEFFERPLAGPADDLHEANPGSHPELLDDLARDFVEHECDVQHLLRTICNSRLYQLDSKPKTPSQRDSLFFSQFRPRRFREDRLQRMIETAIDTRLNSFEFDRNRDFPPLVEDPIKCSRDQYRKVRHVGGYGLYLMGNRVFEKMVEQPQSLPNRLKKSNKSLDAIFDELYFTILSRPPKKDERKYLLDYVEETRQKKEYDRNQLIDDIVWALLNTKEFIFVH